METRGSKVKQEMNEQKLKEYFMGVAYLSGMRSKDSNCQVGACIVNQNNSIVGIGYNGMPNGCADDEMPWKRNENKKDPDSKYPYVCHAEMNAILNANEASVKDCDVYVTMYPCKECAKLMIQSGIKRVFYNNNKHEKKDTTKISKEILENANIKVKEFRSEEKININYKA